MNGVKGSGVTFVCEVCGEVGHAYPYRISLYGLPTKHFRCKRAATERLWKHIDKKGPICRPELGHCWVWTGSTHRGYGKIRVGHRKDYVRRIAYEDKVGPIPEGLNVCHHCDNPPCVRPDHLYAGTDSDNMQDKVRRGRCRNTNRKEP